MTSDTPITEAGLSTRVCAALTTAGFRTLGEVRERHQAGTLWAVPNVGKVALAEVAEALGSPRDLDPGKSLRQAGRTLYRSVAVAVDLNVIERDTLMRAAKLADLAADLEANIAERGLTVADKPNPAVLRLVQVQKAIASLTKQITPKEPGTRHMSRAQRNAARDRARMGYG